MTALMTEEMVTIASEVLGPISIPRSELLNFPQGLYGFPACRSFALLPAPRDGIYWLQSADYSALSFLLVDAFLYLKGYYHIELSAADLARVGTSDSRHLLVLSIVTMPAHQGEKCTANLQAPIFFNLRDRQAFQSIRTDDGFGIREPFDLDLLVSEKSA